MCFCFHQLNEYQITFIEEICVGDFFEKNLPETASSAQNNICSNQTVAPIEYDSTFLGSKHLLRFDVGFGMCWGSSHT